MWGTLAVLARLDANSSTGTSASRDRLVFGMRAGRNPAVRDQKTDLPTIDSAAIPVAAGFTAPPPHFGNRCQEGARCVPRFFHECFVFV
jgi:hypothetical protein